MKKMLRMCALAVALFLSLGSATADANPIMSEAGINVAALPSDALSAVKGSGYYADTYSLYAYNYSVNAANYFYNSYSLYTGEAQMISLYNALWNSGVATQWGAIAMYYTWYNL